MLAKHGFNLFGYATSPLGLGEDLRSFAAMLDYLKIPFSVTDLPTDTTGKVPYHWDSMTTLDYEVSIFFMSPMDCLALSKNHPQVFSDPKTTIGYFLWELPDFPDEFLPALKIVDHIWCPTKFVQTAFMAKSKQLTLCIPLPVIQPQGAQFDFRGHLDIPEDAFAALYMFDMHSTIARKNPQAVVQAFLEFCQNKTDAYLILKVGRWQSIVDHDLAWLPPHPQIKLVTEILIPEHLTDLYRAADCYVSLHRSEGFGRTLVEALQHNLPLVSCAYSGPADFVNPQNAYLVDWELVDVLPDEYPNAQSSKWAKPSVEQAAKHLETIYQKNQSSGKRNFGTSPNPNPNLNLFNVATLAQRYEPILKSYLR